MSSDAPALAARLRRFADSVQQQAKVDNVRPDDPMGPTYEFQAASAEFLAEVAERNRTLPPEAVDELLARVEKAARDEVRRGLPALGRHLDRRTVAVAACALLLAATLGGTAGWWWRGETVVLALDAGVVSTMPDGRRYVSVWIPPAERR
jgi:hypothetical protein